MAKKKKNKRNRYQSRYRGGGIIPNNPFRTGGKYYQGGGMYADNTVQAAGQGLRGSTSNIVYQEQDPRLQQERLASQEEELSRLRDESKVTEQEVKQQEREGEIGVRESALATQQKFATAEAAGGTLAQGAGLLKQGWKGQALKGAFDVMKVTRAANLAAKAAKFGTSTAKGLRIAGRAKKAADAAKAVQAARAGAGAGQLAAGTGSAVGAGLKTLVSSGAGIGAIASLAGAGLKKWGADDDPTTADFGEVGGSALSAAGTGAAIGSVIPGIGTAVGGIVGGLYGAGKSIFSAKKAKKEQDKYKAEIAEKKRKYSADVRKRYGTQGSAVRAGELRGKTYSGYDIGQNIMAQLGGMRMGMPRYGYAA